VLALVAAAWLNAGLLAAPAPAATPPRAATVTAHAPALTLIHQSPWVTPAAQSFTLELELKAGTPTADEVVVSLYSRLTTRSGFEQTITGAPSGFLDRTHPVRWSTMPAGTHGGSLLKIAVQATGTVTPAPPAGAPSLDLQCPPDTGTCTGVYPVTVALERADGTPVERFTTYLTFAGVASSHPLHFAWVVPVAAPVSVLAGTHDPGHALAGLPGSTVGALAGLATSLQSNSSVPVTLTAAPQTLAALRHAGPSGHEAVTELAALSDDPGIHQFLAEPYVPIDLGAFAGAGEGEEIAAQLGKGATVMAKLGIETSARSGPWVATGSVGTALAGGLSQVGATQLVVPQSTLVPAGSNGGRGTWSSTFTLPLGKGHTVTAAASDTDLSTHFADDPADPVLEADQVLADLAMIHFEAPNTPTVRGVVAVPPAGWVPGTAFDDELLEGLTANPDVVAATLGSFFSQVPATPALTPPVRQLASPGPGPVLSPSTARQITSARLRLTAFDSALPSHPAVLGQLDDLLLAAESDTEGSSGVTAGVAAWERCLGGQLAAISVVTEHTITLTARTGHIPITVQSTAPYAVVGTLTVSSDRFVFPEGTTVPMTLDHPTNPVRIAVQARTSGDLPVEVSFVSPRGNLVIAHGEITVRSTATSVVGFVLTALALAVLLFWWARTWRAGRRRRKAAA
jgi:hypothetical protein